MLCVFVSFQSFGCVEVHMVHATARGTNFVVVWCDGAVFVSFVVALLLSH